MTQATNVHSLGEVARFSDAMAKLRQPGDYVAIVRGVTRAIVMSCPDGCGETLTINLDPRAGKAWRKFSRKDRLTVYPSVWRDNGCRSHFIVWNDRIIWCGPSGSFTSVDIDHKLAASVLSKLSSTSYTHYETIADQLDEIPWDVYWTCKDLVQAQRARQGELGYFCKM